MTETADQLMSAERRHARYSLQEFVDYCRAFRNSVGIETSRDSKAVQFFEGRFVLEIEPIGRICQTLIDEGFNKEALVTYARQGEDPPDATITDPQSIGVLIRIEVTTSIDRYLDQVALSLSRQGRLVSTTGHTSEDISGSARRGYKITGYDVEVEEVGESIEKQRLRIIDAISKKLNDTWSQVDGKNVLCIVVADNLIGPSSYDQFTQMIAGVVADKQTELRSSNIHEVFFLGNMHRSSRYLIGESCITFQPINAPAALIESAVR